MKTTMKIAVITMMGMCLGVRGQINDTGDKVGVGRISNPNAKLEIRGENSVYSDFKDYSGISQNSFLPNQKEPTLVISESISGQLIPATGGQITYKGGLSFGRGGSGIYSVNPNPAGSPYYGDIRFHTTSWNGAHYNADRLVIKGSNGNVGIGTTSPGSKLDVNGIVKTNDGRLVLRDNSLEEWKTNGNAQIAVNYYGYNKGTTQFRDFSVYNGKARKILFVKGSTGNVAVTGKLESREIKVTNTPTADFVFEENYDLPTLKSIEKHIKEKKHLPEIASAKEMEENGVNVGNFQIQLLQKIEELTLYTIEQEKKIKSLEKQNSKIEELEKENKVLKSLAARLTKIEEQLKKKN